MWYQESILKFRGKQSILKFDTTWLFIVIIV
jgi:hypothetical protein